MKIDIQSSPSEIWIRITASVHNHMPQMNSGFPLRGKGKLGKKNLTLDEIHLIKKI